MLTEKQINHFRDQGYVALRQFISPDEVAMLREEVDRLIDAAPVKRGAVHDHHDRPVSHPNDFAFTVRDDAHTLNRISNPLAHSETTLLSYGNPQLLEAVASLYGPDFTPFAESIVIKLPDVGAPFDWHQDGSFKTGWAPERGVNFGLYLHTSNDENGCLQVIPASHKAGRADLQRMITEHGMHLPGAVPVHAEPGDVIVHSRNLIHGSFPNTSSAMRVTVYFGYHALQTIAGVYPEDQIACRAEVIRLAIRARQADERFVGEVPFSYPLPGANIPACASPNRAEILRTPALAV